MKQINILKKTAGTLSILLILLSLTACGNAISENNEDKVVEPVENTANGITFKGQIKLHGAAPARSATTSFGGNYTWHIIAQNADLTEADINPTQEILEQAYRSVVSTTNDFTLTLPVAGNWILVIYGFAGTYTENTLPVYTSAIFVYADNNFTISEEDADKQFTFYATVNASALAYGSEEGSLSGSLSLPITCNAETVYQVSAKLKNDLDPDAEPVTIAPKLFIDGESTIVASNIPAGIYTARIFFEDNNGNNLYSCTEAITIYPGLTTDTWFGTAPYFVSSDGVLNFVLTQEMLSTYVTEPVTSTKYVLYNSESGSFGNNYKFFHVEDLSSPVDLESPVLTSEGTSGNVWNYGGMTFDSEGHIYTLFYKTISDNGYKIYKDGTLLADSSTISNNEKYYERISCDTTTDTFYLATYTGNQYIFKVEKDDLTASNLSGELTKIQPSIGSGGKPYQYAVHDGIIYYAHNPRSESAKPMLLKIDFSAGTESTIKALDFNGNVSINDVLYQDGNVYILISESPSTLDGTHTTINARGGVIKYNILTNSLDSKTLGWTNTAQNRTGKWFNVAWFSNGSVQDFLYTSENREGEILAKADDDVLSNFEIYSPESPLGQLNTHAFYGPSSFVAIKPKKLVILDEGIAFYTDAEGLYKYKNVNRIVTVDLEDFAISGTENVPSSISFAKDDTGLKPNVCSYWWDLVLYNEDKEVIFDASDVTSEITLHSFEGWNKDLATVTLKASQSNWASAIIMGFPLGTDE